jgi:hypothetical protein
MMSDDEQERKKQEGDGTETRPFYTAALPASQRKVVLPQTCQVIQQFFVSNVALKPAIFTNFDDLSFPEWK